MYMSPSEFQISKSFMLQFLKVHCQCFDTSHIVHCHFCSAFQRFWNTRDHEHLLKGTMNNVGNAIMN